MHICKKWNMEANYSDALKRNTSLTLGNKSTKWNRYALSVEVYIITTQVMTLNRSSSLHWFSTQKHKTLQMNGSIHFTFR
jgi:hypothetical protein